MTISYPLALPTHTGFAQIELRAINAVAYARSPFTFTGQAFAYPGQMWTADVTLPPMKRADAEQWNAWLLSLRGQLGTFLMGDPNGAAPRGSALGGRVNLLTYSEQFDNAIWVKTNANVSVTANTTIAPDGNLTADTGTISVGGTDSAIVQAITVANNSSAYTYSFYVKRVASEVGVRFDMRFINGTSTLNYACLLTWSTLTITKGGAVATSTSVTDVGSGWYRVSVTASNNSTGNTNAQLWVYPSAALIGTVQAGSVYLWGAQLELGSTATTYQPIFNSYGPYVNGASQTGGSLIIDGASPDETGYLLAGDYIQLGSNGTSTLHKVLTNVDTDSSGNATLDIWPHIRTAPLDNAIVTVSSAKGLFRLSSNEQAWSVNEAAIYGITFGAMEVV